MDTSCFQPKTLPRHCPHYFALPTDAVAAEFTLAWRQRILAFARAEGRIRNAEYETRHDAIMGNMAGDESRQRLPEERQFRTVLWTACLFVLLFLYLFVMLTICKAKLSPGDITSNWFVAWGSWAGGLMTGAAFLIAAYSIVVSSAHSRQDRRDAAAVQAAKDIAQARLLTIYRVDMPDQPSIRFYRIDNRSNDRFFDVSVGQAVRSTLGVEDARLTPESITGTWQVLPENELLTPYRTQEHEASWFTEV